MLRIVYCLAAGSIKCNAKSYSNYCTISIRIVNIIAKKSKNLNHQLATAKSNFEHQVGNKKQLIFQANIYGNISFDKEILKEETSLTPSVNFCTFDNFLVVNTQPERKIIF